MSNPSSRKVSGSSTQSQRHSPVRNERPQVTYPSVSNSSNHNSPANGQGNEWPVWDADISTSQQSNIQRPFASHTYGVSYAGQPVPIINVQTNHEDGWTTVTQSPQQPQQDNQQYFISAPQHVGSGMPVPSVRDNNKLSGVNPSQWFTQPTKEQLYQEVNDCHTPTKSQGPGFPFPVHTSNNLQNGRYESQPIPLIKPDVPMPVPRGMVTEDDLANHHRMAVTLFPPPPPQQPMMRPFNHFPAPDYNFYISQAERFPEFPFHFDNFAPIPFPHTHLRNLPQNGPFGPMPLPPLPMIPRAHPADSRAQPAGFYDYPSPPQITYFPATFPNSNLMMSPPIPSHVSPSIGLNGQAALPYSGQIINTQHSQHPPSQGSRRANTRVHHPGRNSNIVHNTAHTPHRQPRRLGTFVAPVPLRSPLLMEFRSDIPRNWHLKDIFTHIIEFSMDQYGSRFIQQGLESATEEEKQLVFDEIVPAHTSHLMLDVFGNYIIQKLFEFGSSYQRQVLGNAVRQQVVNLSIHIYGCRVVQKALEYITPEQQTSIIEELQGHILTCIRDAHGNHVIQKLIEMVPPQRLTFLGIICNNIRDLSTHPYGCRVLQRCLEHLSPQTNRDILEAIHRHAVELVQDQYGNYVIQFIIEHGRPQDRAIVVAKIGANLIQLSKQKFASNVCERALKHADPETCRNMVGQLLVDNPNTLTAMITDQYANYVLQCALGFAEDDQLAELAHHLWPIMAELRKASTSHNKPIISIEKILQQLGCKPPNNSAAHQPVLHGVKSAPA